MKKKASKNISSLLRAVFIVVGSLLVLDTVFVMTRSSWNLGVMMPLVIGLPLLAIGLFMPAFSRLVKRFRLVRALAFLMSLAYLLFALVFCTTTAFILFNSTEPDDGADVLIVLGAGIRGTSPTLTLKYRLDSAVDYLQRNPDAVCIVSGGQGEDEETAEAYVMHRYLVDNGISDERIVIEDESSSTEENFRFSKVIIEGQLAERFPEEPTVVFTTTRFHVFRSELVARREALTCEGIPAHGVWYITPNDYLRECAAIVVYFITGKI